MTSKTPDAATPQDDRRLDARLGTRLEAVVDGASTFIASGFSRSGAFLRRQDDKTPLPAVGSLIQIMFRWPLETQIPPVRVEARVVRQTEDGVGVHFQIAA